MIVCKFGGTSLADAENIKKVASIIKSDSNRTMIVVSAPGKRFSDDKKVTDLLYDLSANSTKKTQFEQIYLQIKDRFEQMIAGLQIEGKAVLEALDAIANDILQGVGQDFVASRGEFLNALLISEYLGFRFVDAIDFVRLTDDGGIDPHTYELGAKVLDRDTPTVVPGFYGLNKEGRIKTFSRGGSDISGAILAVCVKADVYQNWTDVSGVLVADPRLVSEPVPVPEITYDELRQMARFGANVFHSDAVSPVAAAGIPIQIKNTLQPKDIGTTISCQRQIEKMPVVAISGLKNITKIIIDKENLHQSELSNVILAIKDLGFKPIFSRFAADFAYFYGNHESKKIPRGFESNIKLDSKEYCILGLVGKGLNWLSALEFASELKDIAIVDFSFEYSSVTLVIVVEEREYEKVLQKIAEKIKQKSKNKKSKNIEK